LAPKNKFTKQQMTEAAVNVVRTQGIEALTAKAIANELDISTQPVFTCYQTMDNVRSEVHKYAQELYSEYLSKGLRESVPFYGFGMQYIRFARNEPELYRLLFLTISENEKNSAYEAFLQALEIVSGSLTEIYKITKPEAERFARDMWLIVNSFGSLIVTNGCPYSDEEIGHILTGFSISICKAIKEIPGFIENDYDRDSVFRKIINESGDIE